MADDQAEIDRIVAEQRATPEDLKPQADPPAQAPIETAPEAANEAEGDAEVSARRGCSPTRRRGRTAREEEERPRTT